VIRQSARSIFLDQATQGKVLVFTMARMGLMMVVLLTTIFLRQEVLGPETILQMYAAIGASFLSSLITVSFWGQTMRVRYFLPSQLFYDLLLTSYLVYLTGVSDSIFLFLYLLNIVFASVAYQLPGALLVAALSGGTFAFIYYVNTDMDAVSAWYNLGWHELLFLLAALLCGQLMDELRRQKILLESQRQDIARLELLNDRLLNSIPVGIIVVDQDEYVHKINAAALQLVQLAHPSALRLKYFELLPQLRGIFTAWDQLTEVQRLRFLFSHSDSVRPHLSLQIVRVMSEDQRPQHILVFQDMAKMMELEQKLEFESKLAATGELAAGIAHEIRNPLASISGCIELLSQHLSPENEQDRRLLEISVRETRRLNTLITDFLEFAKPKDNTSELFSLADLVQEVAEAVRAGAGKRAAFALNIPESVRVLANRERMKQVFFNFFLNSLEASPAANVTISVDALNEANQVQVNVRDDGSGIAPQVAERIFDPFFTTKTNGTGLGLPTVAQIIKAAKGDIQLVPSNKGAHFRLRLPSSGTIGKNGDLG
jgi:two-component system sensor histidine kinase PilS (NtrC family)